MNNVQDAVLGLCRAARDAQRELAMLPRSAKDKILLDIAAALIAGTDAIVTANALDMAAAEQSGMSPGLQDRLRLNPERVAAIAEQLRTTADLPDPVGDVARGSTLANGLQLRELRVPLGVIGMVYEARPNVTVDAAGLCLKSGNAVLLRGGSAAENTNAELIKLMQGVLKDHNVPTALIQTIDSYGREGVKELMQARGLVDVLIPRGSANLIQTVIEHAKVPVIETGTGNVHVYIDEHADVEQALSIALNSKTRRVGVCNAAETILVHQNISAAVLKPLIEQLSGAGVTIHGCERSVAADARVVPATQEDWDTEYLSLDVALRVVDTFDEAVAHVQQYTTGHTEVVVTQNLTTAQRYVALVDAAAVIVNASSGFTDGGEFGFGAEIGISTQKLHARGPMGLPELTTVKWVVWGSGQTRS